MNVSKNRRWPTLIAAVLLPLALVAAVVGTMWQANTRTDRPQAAIVNLDEPVTLNGQYVPLGRQLAGKLTSLQDTAATDAGGNYDWVVTNAADASAGLESGQYAAVVTIPKNFSKAATSTAGEVADLEQAVVDVQVSAKASAVDPALARVVVQAGIQALNTDLASTYLDNLYVGFSTMGTEFAKVGDGAGELADGGRKIADGVEQSASGAKQLSTGLTELDRNGSTLATGVKQYTDGVTSLADGLKKLNAGVSVLPAQTKQLADGAAQTAAGAKQMADGVGGVATGAQGVATGAQGVSAGLKQYQAGMKGLPAQMTCAAAEIPEGPVCEGFKAGVKAASEQAAAGLGSESQPTSLLGGAAATAAGAQQVSDGASQLSSGASQLATGTKQLADGTKQLSAGMTQLSQGVAGATSGAKTLAANGPQLSSGVKQYTDGVHQVSTGATQLSTGLGQLSGGADQVADGQRELADGLKKGVTAIPGYTDAEREKLAKVAASPVTTGTVSGPQAFADPATLSALLGIALWLGALLTSTVIGTGARTAWRSRSSSWRVMLGKLLPVAGISAVQGILFGGAAAVLTAQPPLEFAQLVGLGALAGLAFATVNQALALVFGSIGRFVGVAVGLLAITASVVPVTGLLETVRTALPTTSLVDGFTEVTGTLPGLGWSVTGLATWLVLGLVVAWAGMARHRQVVPRLAFA